MVHHYDNITQFDCHYCNIFKISVDEDIIHNAQGIFRYYKLLSSVQKDHMEMYANVLLEMDHLFLCDNMHYNER
jgi:hypothetical protein